MWKKNCRCVECNRNRFNSFYNFLVVDIFVVFDVIKIFVSIFISFLFLLYSVKLLKIQFSQMCCNQNSIDIIWRYKKFKIQNLQKARIEFRLSKFQIKQIRNIKSIIQWNKQFRYINKINATTIIASIFAHMRWMMCTLHQTKRVYNKFREK